MHVLRRPSPQRRGLRHDRAAPLPLPLLVHLHLLPPFPARPARSLTIATPHALGLVSGLTGLAYGVFFGVYPTLIVETFGIAGLSQNWGTMTLAPIPFGNLFNLVYGRIYDGHSVIGGDGVRDCRDGLECYRSAYLVTTVASVVGLAMSVWAIRHDYLQKAHGKRDREREHSREA